MIILDNASYHCCRHPDTPNHSKMRKQECLAFLTANCPTVDINGLTAHQLKSEVRKYVEANIPLEIVRLAEEKGHKVLFTPPYHSDLQPIELVWALVKGNVGRQYSVGTTLELVNQRLEAEFKKLEISGQSTIGRMIEGCASLAAKMHEEAMGDEGTYDADDGDHRDAGNDDNDDSSSSVADELSDDDDSVSVEVDEAFDGDLVEV